MPDLPTSERLARALESRLHTDLAKRAREGEFCDLRSTLVDPDRVLLDELVLRGDVLLAKRLVTGDFHTTFAEMDTWLVSEEGRRQMETLYLPGDRP